MIERRHEIEVGDALACDEVERASRVEAGQAYECPADQRHGEQRTHAHRVVERHDAKRAFAMRIEVLRHMREGGDPLRAMSPRHAFRPRGRAGGVEHQRPGIRLCARRRRVGGAFRHRREAGRICVAGIERDAPDMSRMRALGDGVARHVLVDERRSLGVFEHEIDLIGLCPPVDGRHRQPGKLAGPVQRRGLPAVLQQRDEMVLRGAGRARRERRRPTRSCRAIAHR